MVAPPVRAARLFTAMVRRMDEPDRWQLRLALARAPQRGGTDRTLINSDARRALLDEWDKLVARPAWNTHITKLTRSPTALDFVDAVPTLRHLAAGSLMKRILTARTGKLRPAIIGARRAGYSDPCGLCHIGEDDGLPHVLEHCAFPPIASTRAKLLRKAAALNSPPDPRAPSRWAQDVHERLGNDVAKWLPDCGPLLDWLGCPAVRVTLIRPNRTLVLTRVDIPAHGSDPGIDHMHLVIVAQGVTTLPKLDTATIVLNGSSHTGAGATRWLIAAAGMPMFKPSPAPDRWSPERQTTAFTLATVGFVLPMARDLDSWRDLWDSWLIGGHMSAFRPGHSSDDLVPDRRLRGAAPTAWPAQLNWRQAALGLAPDANQLLTDNAHLALVRIAVLLFDMQLDEYATREGRQRPRQRGARDGAQQQQQ